MLKILSQYEDSREGNECLIKDCIVILECYEKFIVMNIRRYIGWCDHGLNYRCRKEFDKLNEAYNYYHDMVNNRNKY